MRSIVISALFAALPDAGVTCLRFNFRGVEGSGGVHDEGDGERLDALAAIDALAAPVPGDVPLVLTGWSFGADVALSVHDARLAAWLAIARSAALCPRPGRRSRPIRGRSCSSLAEHDEIRAAGGGRGRGRALDQHERRRSSPGASHFFVGRTDKLVVLAREFVDGLTEPGRGQITDGGPRGRERVLRGGGDRREALAVEERDALGDRRLPGFQVELVVRPVTLFDRVLELVEGGILRVEQLAVPPQESIVDHAIRFQRNPLEPLGTPVGVPSHRRTTVPDRETHSLTGAAPRAPRPP